MTSPEGDQPGRSGGFFSRRATLQSPNEALQPETPPPPPPAVQHHLKRPRLSAFSGFLSFLLIIAVVGMFTFGWVARRLHEPGPLTADKVVIIPPAEFLDITAQLEREGVIDNTLLFNAALVIEGNRSKLQKGEYLFHQGASLREVMETLISGKQVLHAVTIPEGLTSEQAVLRLAESDVLGGEVRDMPKEGSLLPETYKITRGANRNDLIRKMQEDQRKIVDQIWARRSSDLPFRSPYEMIILASIVEKETGKADERPRVAGVFINRLQRHMRLQSDPTIVYGLVGGKGSLGHPISRAELDKFSPYNTYQIDGLPPGPIANPGRAALEAVANPSRTQELYFVADGTGGHVFADSLDQHSRNVQRWRQIEKEAKDKIAPDVEKALPIAPPRGGQRGSLFNDQPSFGALPNTFRSNILSYASPSLTASSVQAAVSRVVPLGLAPITQNGLPPMPLMGASNPKKIVAHAVRPLGSFSLGQGLDSVALSQPGPNGGASAAALLDGPVPDVTAADVAAASTATFPLSASRRAELKAKAEKLGLAPGSNELPPDIPPPPVMTSRTASASPAAAQAAAANGHPFIYDASEGTAIDPLLDKSFDLNHAKTVPAIK